VLLKIVYLLTCRVLGLAVVVFRGDRAKDAERWCRVVVEGSSVNPRRPDTRITGGPAPLMIAPSQADRCCAPAANATALPRIQLVSTVAS
jgi:hypothetical protein